ncbi:ATP-binding protein [Sphingomonas sp. ID1715]|uniref:ATP-binding protein n=1 Tax=Sphingomonas sp. ID1715 TaxID=1656898 RepID=UPI00148787AE|nr:ATP-binding protein [Sphingomonas sp. ID1715]NNM76096.1 ATP-binding protein [Sphingomonas sp. ID1715]
MSAQVDLGTDERGGSVGLDLAELLSTRLLVQGNSGSGKSHLLRRLLEGSAGTVQQVVIDPEGDFVTLSDAFGHTVIDAAAYSLAEVATIGGRIRAHRASAVLSLEGLEIDDQMRCAAAFLNALFDAPRDHWFSALVVVDEAQLFAPAAAGEVADDARKASLSAMTNLMCRGRKRGLAGVIATQRLAKLAKNVAAEASNFLMGRTFLDIDMLRAADLLGMERRQAEAIRDLERGQFLGLGPAIARRPVLVRVGAVRTGTNHAAPSLLPLPEPARDLLANLEPAPLPLPPVQPIEPARFQPDVDGLLKAIEAPAPLPELPLLADDEREARLHGVLRNLALVFTGQPAPALYQDFTIGCRMGGIAPVPPLAEFRRRFALALAGIDGAQGWDEALAIGAALPEEMLAPFMAVARAARDELPSPDDAELARIYGTASLGRVKRLLGYMEERGVIVIRTDLGGGRSIALPHLGWTTASTSRAA